MQAVAPDARFRDAWLHRGGISHALVQSCVANRDRPARRETGRRAAQSPIDGGRRKTRYGRVLDHRQRMAGSSATSAFPARQATLRIAMGMRDDMHAGFLSALL